MAGVDLNTFRFDYDLTFAALLMNADGTIYHTYGGRDFSSATSQLSMASFADVLDRGLATHAAHTPKKPRPRGKTVEDLGRAIGKTERHDCYHCHTVHDWMTQGARKRRRWRKRDVFRWQDPVQVGLRLRGANVARVEAKSTAERAGLREGDLLTRVGRIEVLTFGDIQRGLHETKAPGELRIEWRRGGKNLSATLRLAKDWKIATPRVFAWRPSKWPLSPKAGFGGPQLTRDQLKAAGLAPKAFAFRVNYIVTWGKNSHTGRNAARAGIRKGDVVYSVARKTDFESVQHFHAWFRLKLKAGRSVRVELIRRGKRLTIDLPVVD